MKVTFKELSDAFARGILAKTLTSTQTASQTGHDLARAVFRLCHDNGKEVKRDDTIDLLRAEFWFSTVKSVLGETSFRDAIVEARNARSRS